MRFLENEKHGDNAVADQAFDIHWVNSCVGQSDTVVQLEDTLYIGHDCPTQLLTA